eukprot:SAG11_NODE_9443_length_911_cov_0.687192_1_plen_123_part_10
MPLRRPSSRVQLHCSFVDSEESFRWNTCFRAAQRLRFVRWPLALSRTNGGRAAAFMDRLLMTRISRRVLAEQHLAFHRPRKGYIGVRPDRSPAAAARGAVGLAPPPLPPGAATAPPPPFCAHG